MKQHKKGRKSRKRRLWQIQQTGSLAAAFSLAAVCQGYGAQVYVPANDVVNLDDYKYYDLDGDGTNDFLLWGDSADSCFLFEGRTYSGACENVVMADTMLGITIAKAYTAGANIGETVDPFVRERVRLNLGSSGPFYNTDSPRFAGFRMCIAETESTYSNHWGWAHLNVTPDLELEVIAFGYEDVPDTSIRPLVSAAVEEEVPASPAELLQNRPNPFSCRTDICFNLPKPTAVVIQIFDTTGRAVRTIRPSTTRAGLNSVSWNRCDDAGRQVASGVYFYRVDAFGLAQMRKMVILD
jgi:hypothetical protein